MRLFKDGGSNIQGIPSTADQRAIVTAKFFEVVKFAPFGRGLVHEEAGKDHRTRRDCSER